MQHSSQDGVSVPLYALDKAPEFQNFVTNYTFLYDIRLDPSRLSSAFVRLLEIGEWRRLGARLRRTKAGTLEHYIPAAFSAECPGVAFSHESSEMCIAEHPIASKIPHRGGKAKTTAPMTEVEGVLFHRKTPRRLADWIEKGWPVFAVHATVFRDATLLSMTWSHCSFDAAGFRAVLQAWTAVLNGREDQVPQLTHLDQDPFHHVSTEVESERNYVLHHLALQGIDFVFFVLLLVFDMIFRSRIETRMICLPKVVFDGIYKQAQQDFVPSEDVNFISEGDVLCAWWAKTVVVGSNIPSHRVISLVNALDLRGLIKESFPAGKVYIGNAIANTFAFASADEIRRYPLAHTASKVRRALVQQATPGQARAVVSFLKRRGQTPLGPWNQTMIVLSNLHKMRFFDLDLSAATDFGERSNSAALPSFIGAWSENTGPIVMPNCNVLSGKDRDGNWWMQCSLRTSAWKNVEVMIDTLNYRHELQ